MLIQCHDYCTVVAPLEGGLPSREPQILKSLILFGLVCPDFSTKLPNGICTGPKRRYHSGYFSSSQNTVPWI